MTTAEEEVIDLADAIGLAEAAKLMRGRGGRAANVETVRRWCNPRHGVRRPDGSRLVLRHVKLNGEMLTTPAWVAAFERERLRLGLRQAPPAAELPRTDRRRAAGHRRAVDQLRKRGLQAE